MDDSSGLCAQATVELEERITRTGSVYPVIYYFTEFDNDQPIKSPIYVCGTHKFQLIFDFSENNLSISIIKDDILNQLGKTVFQLFVENVDSEKTIKFDQTSSLPLQTNLTKEMLNSDNGWIHEINVDSLKISFIISDDRSNDQSLFKISNYFIQKPSIRTIKWSIADLSDFHSIDPINIEFADLVLILEKDQSLYTLSIQFSTMQDKPFLFKSKVTIHNQNDAKNITSNFIDYIDLGNDRVCLSEFSSDEINESNGWIMNGHFNITLEFSISAKDQVKTLTKRNPVQPKSLFTQIDLPNVDFFQSIYFEGYFHFLLTIPWQRLKTTNYLAKIRVGSTFVQFKIDHGSTKAYLIFEDNSDHYVIVDCTFLNKYPSNNKSYLLTQQIKEGQNEIPIVLPFTIEDAEQSGFVDSNSIRCMFKFNIPNQMENPSFFQPIQLKESNENSSFNVSFNIPIFAWYSPIIILPQLQFNDGSLDISIDLTHPSKTEFLVAFKGHPCMIAGAFIIPSSIRQETRNCQFGGFHFPFLSTEIDRNCAALLDPNNGFISPTGTIQLLIKFTIKSDTESHVSLIQPDIQYLSYETAAPEQPESKPTADHVETPEKPQKYAGLINQGATCYMNSMLQAFFHCPPFRQIVYNIPTTGNEDNPEKSIPLNLQRLFCSMQLSKGEACSTEALTKSFGWSRQEIMVQHDAEEFCRVLMDNLEEKLKGYEELENAIQELFQGKSRRAIRCKRVDYQNFTEDKFLDIPLDVKGVHSLQESFAKYVEKEEMEGNNQIITDEYGKQDATMNVEFIEFPPILHLHLQRFVYDFSSGSLTFTKLNDYFEFPEQIDLTPYLAEDSPSRQKSNLYDLYGVLVHSGSINSGHYNAYLRTSTDKQWYFFNDSQVTPVSSKKAIQSNFGYREAQKQPMKTVPTSSFDFLGMKEELSESLNAQAAKPAIGNDYYDRVRSGYILIYVRHDDAPEIYKPIPIESIPPHIVENAKAAKAHASPSSLFSSSQNNMLDFSLRDEEYLRNSILGKEPTEKYLNHSKEEKMTLDAFYQEVSALYNIPRNEIRLWSCGYQFMPSKIIPDDHTSLTEFLKRHFVQKPNVLVQRKEANQPLIVTDHILVYMLFFYPKVRHPLNFIKVSLIPRRQSTCEMLSLCIKEMRALLGLPDTADLDGYLITYQNKLQKLDPTENTYSRITTGVKLILTPSQNEEFPEIESKLQIDHGSTDDLPEDKSNDDGVPVYDASKILQELKNSNSLLAYFEKKSQIELEIVDLEHRDSPLFRLIAPTSTKTLNLYQIIGKLAIEDYQPNRDFLQLYKCSYPKDCPTLSELNPNKRSYMPELDTISKEILPPHIKYHQIFITKLKNCSSAHYVLASVHISKNSFSTDSVELIPFFTEGNFDEFSKKVRQHCSLEDGQYRLVVIKDSKIHKLYSDETKENIPVKKFEENGYILRFEPIPESQTLEKRVENNSYLIQLCFAEKHENLYWDTWKFYGEPFIFDVIPNEVFADTRQRLQQFFKLSSDESIDQYQFKVPIDRNKFTELLDKMKVSDKCPKASILYIFKGEEKPKSQPNSLASKRKSNEIKIYN